MTKRRPIRELKPEETEIAARFFGDAMRLCVWLWRRHPRTTLEDVTSAGHMGLLIGARSAARRLGAEAEDDDLRAHMMRNVTWRVRATNRNRVAKALRRGSDTFLADDVFEDASATIAHRTDRLSPEDLDDLAAIRRTLATLTDRARAVVLAHAEGRNFAEVGAELGISKQGAHQLFNRAVARARQRLGVA